MAGLNRETFQPLGNFDHALQSVEVIVSTRLMSRVMRRHFGAGLVELLGRLMTSNLFAAFAQLLATAIDLWEPRFRVRRVTVDGEVDAIRRGQAGISIEVDWRPGALLGDFRVERVEQFRLMLGPRIQTVPA